MTITDKADRIPGIDTADIKHPKGWIGVDFDGTLSEYTHWQGHAHVGEPIWPMVYRVRRWLHEGYRVKIFTARVSGVEPEDLMEAIQPIVMFCQTYIGKALEITNIKDMHMVELWDDRCVQVEQNTGAVLGKSTRGLPLDP